MSSKYLPEELINGLHLISLIDKSTDVLRNKFHQYFPTDPTALFNAISIHEPKLIQLLKQKIINRRQYKILLPVTGKTDSLEFRRSVLTSALRELCPIQAPVEGWHTLPSPSDQSEGANLVRIRLDLIDLQHRNLKYKNQSYTNTWNRIASALEGLGCDKQELIDLKSASLDPALLMDYQKNLLDLKCAEDVAKESAATSRMASKYLPEELINGLHLISLMDKSTDVLRNKFHQCYAKDPETLFRQLSIHKPQLIRLLQQKKIYRRQYHILLPVTRKTDSSKFDRTLLFLVLREICLNFVLPTTGWHRLPTPSDQSESANLIRIHWDLNNLYHANLKYNNHSYTSTWNRIASALEGLGCDKQELIDLKSASLDPALLMDYQQNLSDLKSAEDVAKESAKTIN